MSSSTSQAESRAIADVIQTYFDGLYDGDTEKFALAFLETPARMDGK
jgi:hypothetical protein